jgi:hypothetical protein
MEDKFVKITSAVYKILDFFPETEPLKNRAKEKALSIMESLTLSANRKAGKEDWVAIKDYLAEDRENTSKELSEDIEILLSFLKLGKFQGWISDANFLIIYNEYEKIKDEIPQSHLAYKPPQAEALKKENAGDRADLFRASPKEKPKIEDKPAVLNSLSLTITEEPKQKLSSINSSKEKEKKPDVSENFISERQNKILKFLKENKKAQVMDLKKVLSDVTKRTIRRDLDDLLKKGSVIRVGEWNQVFYQIPNSNI